MKNDNLKAILIDIRDNNDLSDSFNYENEINNFIEIHEGDNIVKDIQLLRDMGYDNGMINKIYTLLQPESIERAIDYMTEVDGIFQHDFFENNHKNKDKNLCFICKKPRRCHLDYIPEEFLNDGLNYNNNFNNEFEYNNYLDDYNDINSNLIVKQKETFVCNVCFEDIDKDEKEYNTLNCGHIYCTQCWINYLKTLITEAKVEKIKCMEHKCKEILPEEFILKHIENDKNTVDKYNKFKKRAEIINDPNKKQCPKPDCDSFLQKPKSKKVRTAKCEKGHQFCFDCLRPPHGNSSCEEVLEKDFKIWSKGKIIKKCPKCKIYTEKNEGCNHMTCTSCKYQWCWLCEGEYKYGHYTQGLCNGHQFTKVNYLSEIPKPAKAYSNIYQRDYHIDRTIIRRNRQYFEYDEEQRNCCCSLSTIFFSCLHKVNYTHDDIDGFERLNALMIWFFGYFLFVAYQIYNTSFDNAFLKLSTDKFYMITGLFIAFFLFICYQVLFTCLITPFILISLIYPYFVYRIKMFFTIGKANYYR